MPADLERLRGQLRARGMRATAQRERVLLAIAGLGHATPEEILGAVNADGGTVLPPSTVYRAVEALEVAGAIRHTHLDQRTPSYQLESHDDHLHVVCRDCGTIGEVRLAVLDGVAAAIEGESGYLVDLTHVAVQGRCRTCRTR